MRPLTAALLVLAIAATAAAQKPDQTTRNYSVPDQVKPQAVPQKTAVPDQTTRTYAVPDQTTTKTYAIPTTAQKGGGAYSVTIPVDAHTMNMIMRMQLLQDDRQICQPLRNVGKNLAICVLKRKIGQRLPNDLPPMIPLP